MRTRSLRGSNLKITKEHVQHGSLRSRRRTSAASGQCRPRHAAPCPISISSSPNSKMGLTGEGWVRCLRLPPTNAYSCPMRSAISRHASREAPCSAARAQQPCKPGKSRPALDRSSSFGPPAISSCVSHHLDLEASRRPSPWRCFRQHVSRMVQHNQQRAGAFRAGASDTFQAARCSGGGEDRRRHAVIGASLRRQIRSGQARVRFRPTLT